MAKATANIEVPNFAKEQICTSIKYSKYKDILSSQLKEGVQYTYNDVDKIIDEFLKGKVK